MLVSFIVFLTLPCLLHTQWKAQKKRWAQDEDDKEDQRKRLAHDLGKKSKPSAKPKEEEDALKELEDDKAMIYSRNQKVSALFALIFSSMAIL